MIEEVKEIIAKVLKIDIRAVDSIIKEEEFSSFDSLQFLNFVIELESKFKISIEPEEIESINNFDQVINIIKSKTNQ